MQSQNEFVSKVTPEGRKDGSNSEIEGDKKTSASADLSFLPALVIAAVFLAALLLWYWLDCSVPIFDSASHLLKSYACRDILLSDQTIVQKAINISRLDALYPPLTFFVSALYKIVFGSGVWIDRLPVITFYCLMCLSAYKLAIHLLGDRAAACLAIAILCLSPITFSVSHAPGMMEIPLAAFTFMTFWALALWLKKPTYLNLVLIATAAICTVLTRQSGIIFLLFPLGIVVLQKLLKKDWKAAGQLFAVLIFTGLALMIWLSTCLPEWISAIAHWQEGMPQRDAFTNFRINFVHYWENVSKDLTKFWLFVFMLCLLNWKDLKKLLLPLYATFGGLLCLSMLNWIPQSRYLIQGLPLYSLLIAATMVRAWRTKNTGLRLAVMAVLLIGIAEYAIVNFSPYSFTDKPTLITSALQLTERQHKFVSRYPDHQEYGLQWIIDTIKENSASGKQAPIVCVVPYSEHVNALSLQYVALSKDFPIKATACKVPNLLGFKFDYDENRMKATDWYVFENPVEVEPKDFIDSENAAQCEELIATVIHSKNFELVARKNAFGPFQISLYKRRSADGKP